jgi:hypothetical protein
MHSEDSPTFAEFIDLLREHIKSDDPARKYRLEGLTRRISERCYDKNRKACASSLRDLAHGIVGLAEEIHPESSGGALPATLGPTLDGVPDLRVQDALSR